MKKLLTLLFIMAISLFAYKDSYYIGVYKFSTSGDGDVYSSLLNPALENQKVNHEISGDNLGIKYGLESNEDKEHSTKSRLEIALENRELTYKRSNVEYLDTGKRVALSAYYGKNLNLFLTDELTLFGKLTFGYIDMEDLGQGTDQTFGVNLVYASKYFEVQIGAERELRKWGSHILIPYDYFDPKNHEEVTDNFFGGINIRF